ncbi:Las1-domain-containing protein [Lizonia empirigonia]|nr:Las1-domain-containing protein [Lizonia empirigonia]
MDSYTHFLVTPWRNSQELIELRRDLYRLNEDNVDRREGAVNKVLAWRARKESLPLLLDSTADIVDVILQDEKGGLKHNACRLLYATAISRFITGYLDTQIDLTRDRPSWFPPGKALQPPISLLEVRHCIVHRHMPLLAELKGAGQTALAWLWDWYWSHLESAFSLPSSKLTDIALTDTDSVLTAKLQNILRTYIKSRKSEIKTRRAPDQCTAARDALSTYSLRFSSSATTLPSNTTQDELLRLLVHDKQILPQDKKMGSSMSGAFLIWSPLLLAFCAKSPNCFHSLLDKVVGEMSNAEESSEAQGEGMCEWAAHMLTSSEWAGVRKNERAIREKVLGDCMTELGVWHLRLAEKVVDAMGEEGALWRAILHAEHIKGTKMDAEVEVENTLETLPLSLSKPSLASGPSEIKEKIIGPQKVIGLWKVKPIGWLPEEWDEDG